MPCRDALRVRQEGQEVDFRDQVIIALLFYCLGLLTAMTFLRPRRG